MHAPEPVGSVTYEVELDARGSTGRLLRRCEALEARGDGPCWEVVFGRQAACERCPLRTRPAEGRVSGVLASPDDTFSATLLTAEVRGCSAVVTATRVDDGAVSELLEVRLDHLARRAKLTGREREVLSLMLLGRSLAEMGTAVGITARTAKYHQAKVLRKLGADSRFDLLRLLM